VFIIFYFALALGCTVNLSLQDYPSCFIGPSVGCFPGLEIIYITDGSAQVG